jgi:hypothetical protein
MAAIDPHDTRWYQRAVFYELAVRGFDDSDADGHGDFVGLTNRLDYLDWLGVDCLWLLPFYQSPLRDGGYDISDFFTVQPGSGKLEDVQGFLDAAHRRDMRVIADLVMNHTSDQHPWFVESRQSRTNPRADWYVWADDNERWSEARVIFVDSEPSNWSWDPQREQFYWHRFFHHQPDLNYDNPDVAAAMLDVVRFWLSLGLDGFRLDAVPYLFERDGTNCENLPETHEYLRTVRKTVDAEFPGRVLLAEANQWPADVVDYFGQGDECHMCFHFPLMPRMFMAIRREQRHPITEILAQTPDPPGVCQWGIFLRNHDELTLEMVTDDERDYMWKEYATDPRMKLNLGIRRRLFPLLDPLLRRRDRHGRQHLPGGPRWRPHPHAVEPRPQRRVLESRFRPALSAAAHGSRVRVSSGERRAATARSLELPALVATRAQHPQAAPGAGHRQAGVAACREPVGACLSAPQPRGNRRRGQRHRRDRGRIPAVEHGRAERAGVHGGAGPRGSRHRAVCQQPVALSAAL